MKNKELSERFSKMGAKGGKTAAANMSRRARKERAMKAAAARWKKTSGKK